MWHFPTSFTFVLCWRNQSQFCCCCCCWWLCYCCCCQCWCHLLHFFAEENSCYCCCCCCCCYCYCYNCFFLNKPSPACLSFNFDLFKQTLQFLTTIQCEKMSTQYPVLGFEPTTSWTTRSRLLHFYCCSLVSFLFLL